MKSYTFCLNFKADIHQWASSLSQWCKNLDSVGQQLNSFPCRFQVPDLRSPVFGSQEKCSREGVWGPSSLEFLQPPYRHAVSPCADGSPWFWNNRCIFKTLIVVKVFLFFNSSLQVLCGHLSHKRQAFSHHQQQQQDNLRSLAGRL